MPQNHSLKKLVLLASLLGALFILASNIIAQEGDNLLRDPGFEDTAMKVVSQGGGSLFAVHNAWEGWFTETPRTTDWQNLVPNATGRVNGFIRSGNRSQEVSRGYATFTAAIYQTVTVPANAVVNGGAWVVMDIAGDNASGARSHVRVGIDPTGGNNPLSPAVVWSANTTNPIGNYRQLTVSATAQGTQVTLFLFSTQEVPTQTNAVFWDDAHLRVTGAGTPTTPVPGTTATAVPPPPPSFVPFVSPQNEQSDGSIRHTVQEGDTLSSIAVAYNVPMDTIRELNPSIGQGRYLSIGDSLLIQRASTGPDSGSGLGPSAPLPIPTEVTNTNTDPVVVQPPTDGQPQQPPVIPTQEVVVVAPTQPTVRLHTLYLFTNDLDAVVYFYGDVLGLESQIADDHVIFKLGDVELIYVLAQGNIATLGDWQRQPIYEGGTIESATFSIEVPSAEFAEITGRVMADGNIPVYNDAILITEGNQHVMFLQDPTGLTVALLVGN